MRVYLLLELVRAALFGFSALELMELMGLTGAELKSRNDERAAALVVRAMKAHAAFVAGPGVPSDDGDSRPGDNGADA